MPYGSGPLIRQALMGAKPWQRYLIAVAMVGGGVVLVVIGHVAGALLAVSGVLLLVRMVQFRLRRRQRTTGSGAEEGRRKSTDAP
jgi:hypothetical protein